MGGRWVVVPLMGWSITNCKIDQGIPPSGEHAGDSAGNLPCEALSLPVKETANNDFCEFAPLVRCIFGLYLATSCNNKEINHH